ncbi:glycerophosphodiester phosphodiesterase [Gordonia sp. SID5947]|uniref:glycerophosphodiester phosphodiesterase n=1 Tax=Gordonia sp. SID5947 TaxID=2690315 RepID=UPI00136DCB36|nr:glycerophosphodiester phosphodiesterase family protein [Gordonia sp. SID5947]MYR06808.1 glycerophosphodiester phosphodiesterase [Gordonia sp. SID5947]
MHTDPVSTSSTLPPVEVLHEGHRTSIKWHRARRRPNDPPFTSRRIVEGMAAGASVEVDLVVHGERGFAVLHDLNLGHTTTGRGRVPAFSAQEIRALRIRDNDGTPTDETVLLLDDLPDLFAPATVHPNAVLQLDFKQDAAALDDIAVANFAAATAPIASSVILSCGDAEAVRLLTDAVPGIRIGYDPCHHGALRRVLRSEDFDGFVDRAVIASPDAEMVYLERRLILEADQRGFDMVGAFHDRGRTVDAYTISGVDDDSLRQARRLIALRVDQITTDDAEGLVAAL